MSALMKEIDAIQTDMVCMEGMLEALAVSAYHAARAEHIGNSLEILRDYLGKRAEKLDMLGNPFRMIQAGKDDVTGEALSVRCSRWEEFAADSNNMLRRSEEVDAAYKVFLQQLEELPEEIRKALSLAARDVGAASRKQGFTEGMTAAAGMVCGEGEESG